MSLAVSLSKQEDLCQALLGEFTWGGLGASSRRDPQHVPLDPGRPHQHPGCCLLGVGDARSGMMQDGDSVGPSGPRAPQLGHGRGAGLGVPPAQASGCGRSLALLFPFMRLRFLFGLGIWRMLASHHPKPSSLHTCLSASQAQEVEPGGRSACGSGVLGPLFQLPGRGPQSSAVKLSLVLGAEVTRCPWAEDGGARRRW